MNVDFISRYENIFSKLECRNIIKEIEFFDEHHLLFDQGSGHQQNQKGLNVNTDDGVNFSTSSRVTNAIFPKIKPCIENYINEYSILNFGKFLFYDCKVKKIKAGGGFHSWHYENGSYLSAHRTLVVQVYLNDDFDGGETEFLYQNKREHASEGDVIIFPASYTHTHRGNPPIGGTKYIATTWGWVQPDEEDMKELSEIEGLS